MKWIRFGIAAFCILSANGVGHAQRDGAAYPRNAVECSGRGVAPAFRASMRALCAKATSDGNDGEEIVVRDVATKMADINGDRLADLVVVLYVCEPYSCHQTTHRTTLAVLFRNGPISVRSSLRSVEGDARITSVGRGVVTIRSLEIGPDDPHCCPSRVRTHRLTFPRQAPSRHIVVE